MSFDPYNLQHYLDQLYRYIQYQNERMNHLEKTLHILRDQIDELKRKPYTNIEKVEYKFDQLKVETLEGVLNIGLNPTDPESIDQFDVQQKELKVSAIHKEIKNQIYQQCKENIFHYLEEDCPKKIEELAQKHQCKFDKTYQNIMIEDIKKQIDGRIQYYMQTLRLHESVDVKQQVQFVEEKVKKDIENSITHFLKYLPKEMKGDS
ncbi:spore germination protein GerPC [Aeribacillus alveayuensis]|uniref:Spore germination protein PC n=1 Tax=Aeribacillus alveayuensis TaxID=279215 RepID=A0ABT9VN38_9BACI|nr:spore germination protein GerPC [Bacillus alveayuensis]MDQ0162381.1 spore germination protein PC [Bacillus alveayuensis]